MHSLYKAFFVLLCAAFFAPVQADEFVSVVEENLPYQEVDIPYGTAKIQEGHCKEGKPFPFSPKGFGKTTKLDVARQIHEILLSLGANAFVITDVREDSRLRSMTVTPLVCDLG